MVNFVVKSVLTSVVVVRLVDSGVRDRTSQATSCDNAVVVTWAHCVAVVFMPKLSKRLIKIFAVEHHASEYMETSLVLHQK